MKFSTYASILDLIVNDNTIRDEIKRNLRDIIASHVVENEQVYTSQLGLRRAIESRGEEDFAYWTELNQYIDENVRTPENLDIPIIDAKVDAVWERMINLGDSLHVSWYILVAPHRKGY